MVKYMIRRLLNKIVGLWGFEVAPKQKQVPVKRHSFTAALSNIRELGFQPKTVIDVGVAYGTFVLYDAFPEAHQLLVEPLEEFKSDIEKIAQKYDKVDYIFAAAASTPGKLTINVHPDLSGSSIHKECEDSSVNGVPRTIRTVVLDEVCREKKLEGPYLLKIDVQGAELEVLRGAVQILKNTDYVIIETTLFNTFIQGSEFYEVMHFMKTQGFVTYDILDLVYRPLDGALCQIDVAFVKESGRFRKDHSFATPEQREEINQSRMAVPTA